MHDLNNQSEEVQLAAIKKDGHNIQFLSNPSEELQLAAERNRTFRY